MSELPPESPQPVAPSRKKRWLRVSYSLRTLFVVLLLLAIPMCWLAWQIQIVRKRKEILREFAAIVDASDFSCDILESMEKETTSPTRPELNLIRVPLVRRLFGDKTYVYIAIPESSDPRLIERTEYAFPEANLNIVRWKSPVHGLISLAQRDSLYSPNRSKNVISSEIYTG